MSDLCAGHCFLVSSLTETQEWVFHMVESRLVHLTLTLSCEGRSISITRDIGILPPSWLQS